MTAPAVRVVGRRYGRSAYEIKDFLYRNNIPFTWHDVETSVEAAALGRALGLGQPVPTTVVLEDGTMLCEPRLSQLVSVLGLAEAVDGEAYDLAILGGGPAGLAAAVYGACEGLRVVIVEDNAPGGQAGSTSRIENYLGFPSGLTGADLAQRALVQARRFGVRWLVGRTAVALSGDEGRYLVCCDDESQVRTRAVLVATGMSWRRLQVPGADRLANRGLYYGASLAEAAQTDGDDVQVVGAGNSAGQAALYFAAHARSVTLLIRGESLDDVPMSRYLVERIQATGTIHVRTGTAIAAVDGDEHVESLVLRDIRSGEVTRMPAGPAYVLIGMEPNTAWLREELALDAKGFVLTGVAANASLITATSRPGVFASGDVCSGTVKRVGAAVGHGAMAIQVIADYLRGRARIPAQTRGSVRQFDLLDADHNGHIEAADLLSVARRLVAGFGEPATSARARRVLSGYAELWTALARVADANGDGRVTRAEFDTGLRGLAGDRDVFLRLAESVVDLCDTDDDGCLSRVEFSRMLGTLGVSIEDVDELFRTLDADQSGYLDATEIADALCRFYAGAELRQAVR